MWQSGPNGGKVVNVVNLVEEDSNYSEELAPLEEVATEYRSSKKPATLKNVVSTLERKGRCDGCAHSITLAFNRTYEIPFAID